MKLKLSILLSVFVFATPAFAQIDFFAGYSLGIVDIGPETAHGFTLSGSGAVTDKIVIEGDFTFQTASVATGFGSININVMTFTAGPRFVLNGTVNSNKFKPYVHALAGMGRLSAFGGSSTDFALILGGGVDVPTGNKFNFRFGADYVPVFFIGGGTANNMRVIAGITYRWGDDDD